MDGNDPHAIQRQHRCHFSIQHTVCRISMLRKIAALADLQHMNFYLWFNFDEITL